MWHPRKDIEVQLWFPVLRRRYVGLHGRIGTVRAGTAADGPHNVHVEVDGVGYVVPRGNVRKVKS